MRQGVGVRPSRAAVTPGPYGPSRQPCRTAPRLARPVAAIPAAAPVRLTAVNTDTTYDLFVVGSGFFGPVSYTHLTLPTTPYV